MHTKWMARFTTWSSAYSKDFFHSPLTFKAFLEWGCCHFQLASAYQLNPPVNQQRAFYLPPGSHNAPCGNRCELRGGLWHNEVDDQWVWLACSLSLPVLSCWVMPTLDVPFPVYNTSLQVSPAFMTSWVCQNQILSFRCQAFYLYQGPVSCQGLFFKYSSFSSQIVSCQWISVPGKFAMVSVWPKKWE